MSECLPSPSNITHTPEPSISRTSVGNGSATVAGNGELELEIV